MRTGRPTAQARQSPPPSADGQRLGPRQVRELLNISPPPNGVTSGGASAGMSNAALPLLEYRPYGPLERTARTPNTTASTSGALNTTASSIRSNPRGYRIARPPDVIAPSLGDNTVDLNEFDGYRKIKRNLKCTTDHVEELTQMFQQAGRRRSSASAASAASGYDSDGSGSIDFERMQQTRTQRLQQEISNAYAEISERDAAYRELQAEMDEEIERRGDVEDELDIVKAENLRLLEQLQHAMNEANGLRAKLDSTRRQLELANEELRQADAAKQAIIEEARRSGFGAAKDGDPFSDDAAQKNVFQRLRDTDAADDKKEVEMKKNLEKAWRKRAIPQARHRRLGPSPTQISILKSRADKEKEKAPEGKLALVFTDIQGSTNLWEKLSERMHVELAKHNDTMRALIKEWKGYEVKTQGDSFMVAFSDVTDAICWCLAVQLALMECHWDPLLDGLPDAKKRVVFDKTLGREIKIWNGLRVRMGLHYGIPICQLDPTSGRMDYFGPMVNQSARVQGVALGGMISLTPEVKVEIDMKRIPANLKPRFEDIGTFTLKGIENPVQLQQILPVTLGSRLEDFSKLKDDDKQEKEAEYMRGVPNGSVTVVFCEVDGEEQLKDQHAAVYTAALNVYLSEIRCSATVLGGYVSRIEGSRCTVVFQVPGVAFRYAMELQEQMNNASHWPDALLTLPGCESVVVENTTVLTGLRVKIGLHTSECTADYDSVLRKALYFGEAVTVAALLSNDARGGETQITNVVYDEVADHLLDTFVLGHQGMTFDGVPHTLDGYYCFPKSMPERANYLMESEVAVVGGQHRGAGNAKAVAAPVGHVSLVFTDVQNSTLLWETDEKVMADSVKMHHVAMRAGIAKFRGYEVKTEGDAFMVAFHTSGDAFRWCLYMQERLLHLDYPPPLLAYDDSKEVKVRDAIVWRGLRVRMGVHVGCPQCEVDPVTGRMDYYGQMVNKAARVSGLAKGGQISLSEDVHKEICGELREMGNPEVTFGGEAALKGIKKKVGVYFALPHNVRARQGILNPPPPEPAPGSPSLGVGDDRDDDSESPSRPSTGPTSRRRSEVGDSSASPSNSPSNKVKRKRGATLKSTGKAAKKGDELNLLEENDSADIGGIGKMVADRLDGPKLPEAPTGRVAISFTDIQNSTLLWENCSTMRETVTYHHKLMREGIRKFNGYEVKTEGDAFMVCFYRTVDGIGWCLHMQRVLLEAHWSSELLAMSDARTERDGSGRVYWNGPRVRMGLHVGEKPDLGWEQDECTGRMDYYGRMVNKAARVSSLGKGGEIVISQDCLDELRAADPADLQGCTYTSVCIGEKKLKGIEQAVTCYSLVDPEFEARRDTWEAMVKAAAPPKKDEVESLFEKYQAEIKRKEEDRKRAPTGDVTIVFTDVQSSTKLWDTNANMMKRAVDMHHEMFRRLIQRMGGYEVKTEGDAFMVAFHNPTAACKWCLTVQKELLEEKWPEELLDLELCQEQRDENERMIWRGLRVRMGFHHGPMDATVDPTTERMDYYGPNVNAAARVGGIGTGGEIIASEECVDMIDPAACGHPIIQFVDTRSLKGITQEFGIFRITALALSARDFTPANPPPAAAATPPEQRRPRRASSRKYSNNSSELGLDGDPFGDDGGESHDGQSMRTWSISKAKKAKGMDPVLHAELQKLRGRCRLLEEIDQERQFEVLRIHQHIRLFMHLMRKFCECALDKTKGVFSPTDMIHEWIKQHRLIMSLESPLDTTGNMRRDKKLPKPTVEIKTQKDLAIESYKEEATHVQVHSAESSWTIATSKLSRSIVGHLSKHFFFVNASLIAPLAKARGQPVHSPVRDTSRSADRRRGTTVRFDKKDQGHAAGSAGNAPPRPDTAGSRAPMQGDPGDAALAKSTTPPPGSPGEDAMRIMPTLSERPSAFPERPHGSARSSRGASRMSMFAVAQGIMRIRRGSSARTGTTIDDSDGTPRKPRRTHSGRTRSSFASDRGSEPMTPPMHARSHDFEASDGEDYSATYSGRAAPHRPTGSADARNRRSSSFMSRRATGQGDIAQQGRVESFQRRRGPSRGSVASEQSPVGRFASFSKSPFGQSTEVEGAAGDPPAGAGGLASTFGALPPRSEQHEARGMRGFRGRLNSGDGDDISPSAEHRPTSGERRPTSSDARPRAASGRKRSSISRRGSRKESLY